MADKQKIGKAQLVDRIASHAGITKKQAGEAFDALIAGIVDGAKSGSVGVPGLGTFSIAETAARTATRPGTTEKIQVPAGRRLKFKASSGLKGSI